MYGLYVYNCTVHVPGTQGQEASTDGCKPPCMYWQPNPRPLQEQQVLLITVLFSPAPVNF